ncbi:MAG: LexA family transcriptional regulator [Candidatus Absconditabacterales bacterium]
MTRQSLEYYRNQLMGYYRDQKKLPSYREMMTLFGVKGMRSVSLIVDKLVEAGYIDKSDQGLAPGSKLTSYPVFESVSAGFFSPATDNTYEINIDHYLIDKPQTTYFVKVIGDSMKNAGLLPGDFVIVDSAKKEPRDGEIVIAETDDGVTVKRFRKEGARIWLQPENENYPPLVPEGEMRILGGVIGSFRKIK